MGLEDSLSKALTTLPIFSDSLLVAHPPAQPKCVSPSSSASLTSDLLTLLRASLINSTLAACPSTLLTVSGYSQGAEVVHLAMSQLPTKTTSRIASVVLFGDPKNGTALNGVDARRVMTICHSEDDICKGGDDIGLAHLNYSSDAGTAAIFALSGVARLGITSQRIETRVGV